MKASVIVIAYNEEKFISDCISPILNQTYSKFELIIVNDGSTDKTKDIIKKFKDDRIIYTEHSQNKGFASARNTGLKLAKGDYVFFTDADCIPQNDWIEEGLKFMKKNTNLVAASGISHISSAFEKNRSIRDTAAYRKDETQRLYHIPTTLNGVYKRKILNELGGFDELYNLGMEDGELGLRLIKSGNVGQCKKMVVFHQPKELTFKKALSFIQRRCTYVHIIKHHSKDFPKLRRSDVCYGFILAPLYFFSLFFPPLLLLSNRFQNKKIKSFKDLAFFIPFYFGLWYLRFMIWKTAFKERIFLI